MQIIVVQTSNPTPERSWDYMAYFERDEETGPYGGGVDPASAVSELLTAHSELGTMEIQRVIDQRQWVEK